MKMRRLLACIMALLLSTSLPVSVLADTYDLAEGSVSVNASENGQTVTHKEETRPDSAPVITQSGSKETATANTVTIEAGAGSTAKVTLKDVNISADGAAVEIKGSGSAVIELDGKNTVQSGEGHAGVEKNNTGTLTIADKNDSPGSLEATGGAGGAGIGGGAKETDIAISGSDIPISGGTAGSSGSTGGVGIGGGEGGNGSDIPISGGTVGSSGSTGGVGIGGESGNGSNIPKSGDGVSGDGSGIYLSGGNVTAKGGENAAGIGGGAGGNGSDIVISGGRVEATGGDAPNKGSGDKIEIGEGGGAGIGGGANGTGSDIFIKDDAVVTATGKGNAADIGNGHSADATEKQANNVNVDDLYTTGSVNGKPGTKEPPKKNDNGQSSGGGYTVNIPSNIRAPGSSGNMESWIYASDYIGIEKDSFVKVRILGQNDQNLPSELKVEKNQLTITAAADNVMVSGYRNDLKRLNDQGIDQINLETNRLSVSVNNDLLLEITNEDESFQLHTESTGFRLTTTDQNHQKKFDMKLTTDGTQEEQQIGNGTQEEQQHTNGQIVYKTEVSLPNDDSLNSLLHILSASHNATLTLSGDSLQTLTGRGIATTALTAGGLTIGFENSEVMEKIVTTLASGELTIDSENGGVVKKTDANVERRLGHTGVILENKGGQSDNAMGIILYTNGGESDNAQGSQTTDCSWMTKYFTNFKVQDG